MSSNAHVSINDNVTHTDATIVKAYPLRGPVTREHLLPCPESHPKRTKIAIIRDTVISIMGAISALIPICIAIQTMTGV